MNQYWLWYGLGVALPFIIKWANHMLKLDATTPLVAFGRVIQPRWSFVVATLMFLFNDVRVATTTVTTWAAEWVIGAVYVDKLPLPFGPLGALPMHASLSFLLGVIGELIAPLVVKWIIGMLPGGKQ